MIIKGGHLPSADIVDLLYDGQRFMEFRTERVAGRSTHGTGCTFAAAMAAHLALGHALEERFLRRSDTSRAPFAALRCSGAGTARWTISGTRVLLETDGPRSSGRARGPVY